MRPSRIKFNRGGYEEHGIILLGLASVISAAEDREVRFGETPKPTPETDVLPGKRNASTRLHSFRRGKLSEAATGMIAACSKRSVALLISGPRIKSKQKLFENAFTQSNI